MKKQITLESFISFCQGKKKIELIEEEKKKIIAGRKILETLIEKQPIYGINTGVGPFFDKEIKPEDQAEFQRNLILSHATGVGPPLSREIARGVMFLLINMLRKGHSGISLETLQFLINLFNKNIIPAIPEQGSVGASGDLAPLAHLAAVLIGEGHVLQKDNVTIPTRHAFEFDKWKIQPVVLKPGEALALINGTHFMTSLLAHAVWRAQILYQIADIAVALTFLALGGDPAVFDDRFQKFRPHPGQKISAKHIRSLLSGNSYNPRFLQDAYSLRCSAQVHGSVQEVIDFVKDIVEREINSITGNPICVPGGVLHGGNFHGQILGQAADFLGIALTTLGNISERRTERLLNPKLNDLPAFLSKKPGLDPGLMVAQYTAAALVSENKALAYPSSVDSIPLAAGQEDFVSMGAWAARTAWQICRNTSYIFAIELFCVARALEFKEFLPELPVKKIYHILKDCISFPKDHILAQDIETMRDFVWGGEFLRRVNEAVQP